MLHTLGATVDHVSWHPLFVYPCVKQHMVLTTVFINHGTQSLEDTTPIIN